MTLSVRDLTKSFAERQVLFGVSFDVQRGKALGLLGRNGAGKTTVIRIIMDVFPSNSGQVLINGEKMDYNKLRIGYMPEERGMYPKKQVLQQLIYFGELKGLKTMQARKSAKELMEKLQIEEYLPRKLDTLSKGNQQKVQLAATLIADPDIVILDEPFSGLDPVNAMLLKDLIKDCINRGKIVLFSSHQMSYVEEFCDDIVIIHKGNVVLNGNIRTIKQGYDRSTIKLRSQNAAAIAKTVKESLTSLVRTVENKADEISLQLYNSGDKIKLLEALLAQNLDFEEFRVHEPSLNDIFVEYTGKDTDTAEEDREREREAAQTATKRKGGLFR